MQCQSQLLTLGGKKSVRDEMYKSRGRNVCEKRRKTEESEGGDTSREEGGWRETRSVIQNSEQTEDTS